MVQAHFYYFFCFYILLFSSSDSGECLLRLVSAWTMLPPLFSLHFFFIVRCLSAPSCMHCIFFFSFSTLFFFIYNRAFSFILLHCPRIIVPQDPTGWLNPSLFWEGGEAFPLPLDNQHVHFASFSSNKSQPSKQATKPTTNGTVNSQHSTVDSPIPLHSIQPDILPKTKNNKSTNVPPFQIFWGCA